MPGAATDAAMGPRRWPDPLLGRRRQLAAVMVEVLDSEVNLHLRRGYPGVKTEEGLSSKEGL